jgi:hypothetical protein
LIQIQTVAHTKNSPALTEFVKSYHDHSQQIPNMALQYVSNALEELQNSKAKHAEEMKELKRKHKREFDALRLLWDKDREELRSMEAEVTELREEKDRLAGENEALRRNQAVNGSSNDHEARKSDPLFMKGAEMRLRQWELNKMVLYNTRYDDLNLDVIERGNVAAHHQDLKADVALFEYGYLSEESEGATFEKIYAISLKKSKSIQTEFWFNLFCAVVDSQATLRLNISTDSQTKQVMEYPQCCDIHRSIYEREVKDTETKAEEIFKLQKLTAKLVDMERKKNKRR